MHLIGMGRFRTVLVLALLWLCGARVEAAHTQVRLALSAATARPGQTVLAGVVLRMDPGWHTYWRNAGASGIPTKVAWELPPGVKAGPLQWPAPEKLPDADLTTYIYSNEVVLLAPIELRAGLSPGRVVLRAQVSWLECQNSCIPGRDEVEATLEIGAQTAPSKDAAMLESWQAKLPKPATGVAARAAWEKAPAGNTRPLILEWTSTGQAGEPDFYPDASEAFEVQPETEVLAADAGKVRLRKLVKKSSGDWPAQISGVLVQKTGSQRLAYEGTLPIAAAPSGAAQGGPTGLGGGSALAAQPPSKAEPGSATVGPAAPVLKRSVWQMLLYAFLGGLILNIMPCVLPVITLKILGFVNQGGAHPGRTRALGTVYGLGVLASFLLLAAGVVGVQAAGHKAGWGMQFSSPEFVVALATIMTLISLNLFGLFEVRLGGRVMGAAGGLAARHGLAGAFFNGVLATVLATSCSAPYLGAALGFAFAQPPVVVALFFLTIGLGMAAPYVVLSWFPAWLRLLPKPGPWMERFKVAMGFPMLATAAWLFSVVPAFYGPRSWWLLMFLLLVALAAWVYGQFVQRGDARRWLGLGVSLGLIALGYFFVLEDELQWRSPVGASVAQGSLKESADGIDWQAWSPAAVTEARAEGRPVLVDFTAIWCANCQYNKRWALEVPSVRQRLREIRATALLGDYTRGPTNILEELNRYGRAAVPLVLVYPKEPQAPAIVLHDGLLTAGEVLDALDKASR